MVGPNQNNSENKKKNRDKKKFRPNNSCISFVYFFLSQKIVVTL